MDSSDIIEIGEDGTFEIPITKNVKSLDKVDTSVAEKTKCKDFSLPDVAAEQNSVLDYVGPGEFKIFRNQSSGTVYALVCLQDDECVKSVSISQNSILIELIGNKKTEIPLSVPVNASTAVSKQFRKYITVQVKCLL